MGISQRDFQVFEVKCNPSLSFKYRVSKDSIVDEESQGRPSEVGLSNDMVKSANINSLSIGEVIFKEISSKKSS